MKWGPRASGRLSPPRAQRVVLVSVVAALLALMVMGLVRLQIQTSVASFVPQGEPVSRTLEEVASAFGGDPIVVLLESERPGALLSGEQIPRMLELEGKLSQLPDVASVYGPATVLNQIAGQSQNLLAELTGYRDGLRGRAERDASAGGATPAEVREAGVQATAEFDRRYGPLLVQGLPGGLPTLHNDRFVQTVVYDEAGEPRPQWKFIAPAADAVSILVRPRQNLSQEAAEGLVSRVRQAVGGAELDTRRVTVSGVPTVVAAMGDQVRREVPVLGGIALLAVGAWFLLVRWTTWRRRMLPVLTTVTATGITLALFGWFDHPLSLGAVAFLPVLLGIGSDFVTYLHRGVGRRMVVAVGLATAASFASLAITPIPAVRELGLTLALGIAFSLAVGLVIARWLPGDAGETGTATARPRSGIRATTGAGRPVSLRTRITAGAVVGALSLVGWVLLPRLPLQADMASFAAGLPVLEDATHVQDVIGSSGEIVIAVSGKDTVSAESLDWMQRAQAAVVTHYGDQMRPVLSPPSLMQFLGNSPTPDQLEAALRLVPRYLTSSVIRSDKGLSVLSFGVQLDDAQELQALRDNVRTVLPPPPEGLEVAMTGLPMVAVSAYEGISGDRYLTNVLGIAAAGAVLAIGLRRRRDALKAVAAATLATGLGLLAVSIGGVALTPITVALGSLTAAVGCEFTVVLAEAARRRDRGMTRAVLLAAAASATGYAVLVFSDLNLVRAFGLMLAGSVGLAILSAAFVVWLSASLADGQGAGVQADAGAEGKLVGAM